MFFGEMDKTDKEFRVLALYFAPEKYFEPLSSIGWCLDVKWEKLNIVDIITFYIQKPFFSIGSKKFNNHR